MVLDRFRRKDSAEPVIPPSEGPMDDTPPPIETQLVPLQPKTIAAVDQTQIQPQGFARARAFPNIFYNAQMDFPGHIQKAVMDVQAAFEAGDWTYFMGGDSWFRLNSNLDMIAAWVGSQIDAKGILRGQTITFFDEYDSLSDSSEDMLKVPFKKVEMIGAAMQVVGMALKETKETFAPLDRDKMLALIDPGREIGTPERIGVLQIAAEIAEAARERRDCFVVIDVSPRIRQFGAGKSQLMVQLLAETNAILHSPFDIRHDIVYAEDHKRFNRLLTETMEEHAFGVDELDQFAYSREAMKGQNRDTMQTLKQTRKWGRPIIGCSASLWQLDLFLRDIKISHRVRIEEWDSKSRSGRAAFIEKGGFPDPPNDRWGRWPPLLTFEFNGLPADSYREYFECARMATEHSDDGMDKFLRANPAWLSNGEKATNGPTK